GVYLSFLTWKGAKAVEEKDPGAPQPGYSGLDHICITVDDMETLYRLKSRLEAADIWVSEVIDHGFVHSIFTFDPNGIAIEIGCPVKGRNLDDEFRMKDPSPTERAKEGPLPNPKRWPEPDEVEGPGKLYKGQLKELFEE
ncbi:MAG: VOC family protein, partial [Nitrospirae bacterium]